MTHTFDWTAQLAALGDRQFNAAMPMHVFLGEAVDVARFCAKYWLNVLEPGSERIIRFGLESAKAKLPETTGPEILQLVEDVQKAQTRYLLIVDPKSQAKLTERALFLLDEISGVLEFYFDDGVEDEDDARFAKAKDNAQERKEGNDALASSLSDFVALAQPHRPQLAGLGGFDVALIDEAIPIIPRLRDVPQNLGPITDDERKALKHRNGLALLLQQRMNTVRSAAKWVFRGSPGIIREATSTYMRRRRAEARRAAAAKKAAGGEG